MSRENVEIVRRALDAYARRDVEALRALNDPDVVLDWSPSVGRLAGVYRGMDETLHFYEHHFETFEAIVIKADRFMDGVQVEQGYGVVVTLCNGRISHSE